MKKLKMKNTEKINFIFIGCCLLVVILFLIFGFNFGVNRESRFQTQYPNNTNNFPENLKFIDINGKKYSLSDFKNKKVMLWLFATWCPACVSGLKVLSDENTQLKQYNFVIIALKTYNNAGFPGPDLKALVNKNAPNLLKENNWVFGEATKELTSFYNKNNYPDIYYLIDEQGRIKEVNSAPAATLDTIIKFLKSQQ